MVCDYYIHRHLLIEHLNGTKSIEVSFRRGYFPDIDFRAYDSDEDDDYEDANEFWDNVQAVNNQIQSFILKPREPVVIFENGDFVKESYGKKYYPFLIRFKKQGHISCINEIIKVTRVERKYLQHEYFKFNPDDLYR